MKILSKEEIQEIIKKSQEECEINQLLSNKGFDQEEIDSMTN